ncbi:receptor-type tyrosine-protein phosphatase O [Etheostoma cragini]|uniref:receptor-type tyrosine-protein phosphatase O n=1 Tax=Etheostoma cragini TaxID=417921 RepID=UPI00155E596D|nr:receptor-type tyrosine-protein phosphatase O [Etheostoma cragini]
MDYSVILSWQRTHHVAFRKYVLQTFFFNPFTLAAEWTTYYEIAATASVIASVRVTDLLPAWYYNFRVSMVTWGDPPLSCCDSSTVSFVQDGSLGPGGLDEGSGVRVQVQDASLGPGGLDEGSGVRVQVQDGSLGPGGLDEEPLPVRSLHVADYRESPETGVVFQFEPPAGTVFSRVNISFTEGPERRSMLYKDFYQGKTVFKHWLPGMCYRNITFQLISEATVSQTTLVTHSDVTHTPVHHRTVPSPPLNISHKIVHLSERAAAGQGPDTEGGEGRRRAARRARDVPLMEEDEDVSENPGTRVPLRPAHNRTAGVAGNHSTDYWLDPTEPDPMDPAEPGAMDPDPAEPDAMDPDPAEPNPTEPMDPTEPAGSEDEFVNAAPSEYEDSNEPGSAMALPAEVAMAPTRPPPVLLELRWLPPRPPAVYDGFNVYVYRDGNATETATVDENTHEFFSELTEPGTYRVRVATLSSAGDCEARESAADTGFTFYLSPGGELLEELRERPQAVSVRRLDSSTAAVSWAPSSENHNGSLVSVVSTTCRRPSLSQRMENTYCSEENSTSDIISHLTPGAQYRVVVYYTNGPLTSPPSEPVIIDIGCEHTSRSRSISRRRHHQCQQHTSSPASGSGGALPSLTHMLNHSPAL